MRLHKMKSSVVIPIYNAEKYLNQCLDSLLIQDYSDYEIILVDDGSPDCCGAICDEYAEKDTRIKVIHQKNAGVSAARNAGMSLAKGEYITFVDSDDWVDSDYLSTLVAYMKPSSMTVCDFTRESETLFPKDSKAPQVLYFDKIAAEQSVIRRDGMGGYVCAKLFDKKIIDQFQIKFCEGITILEDQLFTIQYLSHIKEAVTWIHKECYYYRQHSSSAMHVKFQDIDKTFSECKAIQCVAEYITPTPESKLILTMRLLIAKCDALCAMEINGCKRHEEYKKYLCDIRKNLSSYLWCDIGQGKKDKIKITVCCIHPRLLYFVIKIWRKIKQIKYHMKRDSKT